ncbi:MAG: carbohydrate kinase family protein [Candidatus Bathyarchaeota archaeon]|nr:MAG: carbohydrate kinase family protein [Candidatus Bathyarchaeota archaeon]
MMSKAGNERVWPYILPFPLDLKKRGLLWSILQSRIGLKILGKLNVDKRTYQHELVKELPYSNKSIIGYLKKMVNAAVLSQGMEAITEKGRTVWIKWFEPTRLGKWLILFLKTPDEISLDLAKAVIEELFHLYASSIVEACQKYDMDIDLFHRVLDRQYLSELVKQPEIKPDVAVFGSAAMDIYGSLKKLPASDEVVYVEEMGRYPGGMGANVAIALARLNVPVAFSGEIGCDSAGRMLLENFRKNNVDTSKIIITNKTSLQTLILRDNQGHRWLFAIGSPQSSISLTSLEEVDWKVLASSKIIYIGEVFVEIAASIAKYAHSRNKIIIYRPGAPYMKFGIEHLDGILKHTTIFIQNQQGWRQLQSASREKMRSPAALSKHGPENVILTKGADGCEIFSSDIHLEIPVQSELMTKFNAVDQTGAGDGFIAGLIKGLLGNLSLQRAVAYGQVVASITCSRMGTSNAFPAEEEVEVAMGTKSLA